MRSVSSSSGVRLAAARALDLSARSAWGDVGAVGLAVLIVGGPALLTRNGFASDFTNHLWLVWVQAQAISQHLAPTYFVNAPPVGVFYPFFAFYGGTLYAAAGAVAALLDGHVVVAYVGVTLLGVAAAYGGVLWLSRQLGARGWMAQAPAITFVGSAYYVTNLYGRGAWTELMATSAIPLLLAGGWRLTRSPRIELVPAALFVIAAVLFAGSHNVTLVLGSLVLVAGLILLGLALGRELLPLRRARIIEIGALLLLGVAVDAWFLLPDIAHASDTVIGVQPIIPWSATGFFNSATVLFNPLRAVPSQSTTPALFVQAPDWFLFWALAAGGLVWSGTPRRLRRAGCALLLLLLAILALIMIRPLWDAMPRTVQEVQLPYRLNTYVALCAAGLVLIGVLAVQRNEPTRIARVLRGALAGATAISIGLCLWQLWSPNTDQPMSYRNRDGVFVSTHLTPRTWYDQANYADASQPVVSTPHGSLVIDPARIDSDHVTLSVTPPQGLGPFATNVSAGPYAVKLGGGLVRAGRTNSGLMVARRVKGGSGPVSLSLAPAAGSVALGRIISLVAVVLLLIAALVRVAGASVQRFRR